MTAMMKTPMPAELQRISNVPFPDKNIKDVYRTQFQEDYPPFYSKKAEPVRIPPAKMDHKDLRYNKEYLTEFTASYPPHPLSDVKPFPKERLYQTNFRMPTNPQETDFVTTHAKEFPPHPLEPRCTLPRPKDGFKIAQTKEKLSESTTRASFVGHQCGPLVKATPKHQESPTIKGDERHHNVVSHYKDTHQGVWARAAETVERLPSVKIGGSEKIRETTTTHADAFRRPNGCRRQMMKQSSNLNLGRFPKESWSTTSADTFPSHEFGGPVVRVKNNTNLSSLPEGDTDVERNKKRRSETTNRATFTEINPQRPSLPTYDLVTKSHIQLSSPKLSDQFYTTTINDHYGKKDGGRPAPVMQPSGNILSGSVCEPGRSITMTDFTPKGFCKKTLPQSQQQTNFKFPLGRGHYITTHKEEFTVKPLSQQQPASNQLLSHIVLK